jgi:uncharacterized membrane protein YfcA
VRSSAQGDSLLSLPVARRTDVRKFAGFGDDLPALCGCRALNTAGRMVAGADALTGSGRWTMVRPSQPSAEFRMDIYLPIAEMSANLFLLLGLGGAVGFLSGILGVGGGFLLTPLLILIGIPPPVAVGTQAPQILASSFSGMLAHMRRGNVDVRMGVVLVVGGLVGSVLGVWLFGLLRRLGQIDLSISLAYILLLGTIGALMLVESVRAWLRVRARRDSLTKRHRHLWLHGLPLKMRFHRSRLYISALMPLGLGVAAGILVAIMGVGGGFMMVPAMIYLIGMPTAVVIGTSLFQITFVTAATTFLHAASNRTVDVFLALALIVGGVIGAQLGSSVGHRLRAEQLRVLLALIVLGVCAKIGHDLVVRPVEIYSLDVFGSS